MKPIRSFAAVSALLAAIGCAPKEAPMQKAWLYAPVDTTCQKPFTYSTVNPYDIFPQNWEFVPRPDLLDAEMHDGVAIVELEINRPVRLAVIPVRDSTMKIAIGESRYISPGDSLEVRAARIAFFTTIEAYSSDPVGGAYRNNTCEQLLTTRFAPAKAPRIGEEDDLASFKARFDAYTAEKEAFLDSCSRVMPLSEEYLRHTRQQFAARRYAELASARNHHPELEVPEGYLEDADLSDEGEKWVPYYSTALISKYITRDYYPETELHYAEIEQRIARAPRKLRDYLTVLQIGHFAAKQGSGYAAAFEATVERARRQIRDTLYLNCIERAKAFYDSRRLELPDSVLQQTRMQEPGSEAELTLGEVLQRYEGRPLYIDFWASWCAGCILDMERSAEAKAWLEEQGIVYLCVSIDESAEAWLRASERNGVAKDSYRCLGETDSPLARLLTLKTIPRYLLLDREHRIFKSHAPNPIPQTFAELKKAVSEMKQPAAEQRQP